MSPIFIHLNQNFSDCVPPICAYLLMANFGPNLEKGEIEDCFEHVGEMLATCMKTACACGCPVRDSGVLVALEKDKGTCKCRMRSLCSECLPKFSLSTTVVTLGEFEDSCLGMERNLQH
jgi:hypothetical protein